MGEIASTPDERCFLGIEMPELQRLAGIAAVDRAAFFHRNPRWRDLYEDRVLCVALCQGSALHYVDGRNGIKDWDVWTFYAEPPGLAQNDQFPPRRRGELAFGDARFGRCPVRPQHLGRPVDLIGRSIPWRHGENPVDAVVRYLRASRTTSARCLAAKAVVLLDPADRRGEIVWPVGARRVGA